VNEYRYGDLRPFVFTEKGQEGVLAAIRAARRCFDVAGAARAGKLLDAVARSGVGDGWEAMACVDRLRELNMLAAQYEGERWQDTIFVPGVVPLP
jgi:hypothetical protein